MDRFEGLIRAIVWIAKAILALFLASISSTSLVVAAAPVDAKYCGLKELEVEQSHFDSPLSLQKVRFKSSTETSQALLQFSNSSQRPMDFVLMLVEFRKHGEYLLTMAFFETTNDRKDSYVLPLKLSPQFSSRGLLPATVLPLGEATLAGYTPTVAFSCPDTARVTLMETGVDGHKDFSYAAPGWRFDAFLDKAGLVRSESAPSNLPVSMGAQLSVDSAGHPTVLTFGGWGFDLATWLQRQVEEWTFVPAVYDGKPVTSEQTIVFRFHPKAAERAQTVSEDQNSGTAVLIDMGLPVLESTRNRVLYGGAPVTVVDRIKSPERK